LTVFALHYKNFAAPIRRINGFTARVMQAHLYDELGIKRKSCVFVFPKGSRGAANMLIYWLMQLYVSAPTSTAGWFIQVPTDVLRRVWPEDHWPDTHHITCFALQSMGNAVPTPLTINITQQQRTELLAWSPLPLLIGINEIACLNTRAPVMRMNDHEFIAPDGAQILGGEYWTIHSLKRLTNTYNHLAYMVDWVDALGIPREHAKVRVLAACLHTHDQITAMDELIHWLPFLLPDEDAQAAVDKLSKRSDLEGTRWKPADSAQMQSSGLRH
jgi:hypothetical protein